MRFQQTRRFTFDIQWAANLSYVVTPVTCHMVTLGLEQLPGASVSNQSTTPFCIIYLIQIWRPRRSNLLKMNPPWVLPSLYVFLVWRSLLSIELLSFCQLLDGHKMPILGFGKSWNMSTLKSPLDHTLYYRNIRARWRRSLSICSMGVGGSLNHMAASSTNINCISGRIPFNCAFSK